VGIVKTSDNRSSRAANGERWKYRFSLQWGSVTVEQVQAGELLESLGNRKSEFIVMAVAEYIKAHPETLSSGQKLKIVVNPKFTREQIEEMVRAAVEEKLANMPPAAREGTELDPMTGEQGVEEMLSNLDVFSL
jgi:stalled ribosome rescue protein Dom34